MKRLADTLLFLSLSLSPVWCTHNATHAPPGPGMPTMRIQCTHKHNDCAIKHENNYALSRCIGSPDTELHPPYSLYYHYIKYTWIFFFCISHLQPVRDAFVLQFLLLLPCGLHACWPFSPSIPIGLLALAYACVQ